MTDETAEDAVPVRDMNRPNGRLRPNWRHAAILALLTTAATPATVSDRVGVYGVVDRVVFEPNEANPTAVQVWGVFSIAQIWYTRDDQLVSGPDFNAYYPAQRGYLYYRINDTNPEATLAEWRDLREIAGSGVGVAFGSRFGPGPGSVRLPAGGDRGKVAGLAQTVVRSNYSGWVRPAREKPSQPDPYPLGVGVTRITYSGPAALLEAMRMPAPLSPADGASVRAGTARLVVRALRDPAAQYVFEIETASGQVEKSEPVAAQNGQATWTARLRLQAGQSYTWRVRATTSAWTGQPADATFTVNR
jgi:hypothetical protein